MTNEVKVLSDDELNHLESKSQDTSLDYAEVDEVLRHVPALCGTVRALRAEREKAIGLLSPNIPRTDLCDAARQIVFAHALEKGNAEKLQESNTALREQLAHWQERTRERTGEVEQLQSQLAQVTQERTFAVRFLVKMGYERCTDEDHGHDCHWHERL